jgi:hypothetical protein
LTGRRDRLFAGVAALALPLFAPTGGLRVDLYDEDTSYSILHGLFWLRTTSVPTVGWPYS